MAQFDVFPNPSRSASDGIPYVVVVQSDLLDSLPTRLVMPLAEQDPAIRAPAALCPVIKINGQRFRALSHFTAPLPASVLKHPVDNIVAQGSALVSAIDAALSGV